ncbi:MAG: hypothetical protein ABJQ93_14550, partial [Luteolibacter sp.]
TQKPIFFPILTRKDWSHLLWSSEIAVGPSDPYCSWIKWFVPKAGLRAGLGFYLAPVGFLLSWHGLPCLMRPCFSSAKLPCLALPCLLPLFGGVGIFFGLCSIAFVPSGLCLRHSGWFPNSFRWLLWIGLPSEILHPPDWFAFGLFFSSQELTKREA